MKLRLPHSFAADGVAGGDELVSFSADAQVTAGGSSRKKRRKKTSLNLNRRKQGRVSQTKKAASSPKGPISNITYFAYFCCLQPIFFNVRIQLSSTDEFFFY